MLQLLKTLFFPTLAALVLLAQGSVLPHGPGCNGQAHVATAVAGKPIATPHEARHDDAQRPSASDAPCHEPMAQAAAECCSGLCLCASERTPGVTTIAPAPGQPPAKALAAASHVTGIVRRDLTPLAGIRPPPQAPPLRARSAYRAHYARTSRQLI